MDIAAHSPHKTSSYIIVAVAYVCYLMVFTMFFDRVGWAIAPLAIIPVTAGSWYFGIGGGLLIVGLSIVANVVLPTLVSDSAAEFTVSLGDLIGSAALFALAGIIGRISSITHERRDALGTLEKQVKQLTVLHEVALISTQVDSVDQLIERVTEIIGKNLFPDNFGIMLMDHEKGVLRAHPSYRFVSARELIPTDVPIGQGVTGRVAETGQAIRVGNVADVKDYIDVDQRTSSELCVPITLKNRVLGVINTESTKLDAFSPDDELLLGTLAGQLATAIEELRAVQAERQWLNQLAHSNGLIYALAHIMTHIEQAMSQEEIIHTVSEELGKIKLACVTALYDPARSLFVINYMFMASDALRPMEQAIGFPLIESAFSLEKLNSILSAEDALYPAIVDDHEEEIRFLFTQRHHKRASEILEGLGIEPQTQVLRLPFMVREKLQGILWVWGTDITRADLPVLSIFAKQIGTSLERARLFREVQSLALTDPLTGLQNRRSLFELGKIEFARADRMARPFCCMMIDLDRFKQINDQYGHPIGDQVLEEFSKRCRRLIRGIDLVGRYGGEEFVILLPETSVQMALHVAERLRACMEDTPIRTSAMELTVTVSIGVSAKDENTLDLETLLARADQAMYIAKHKGRNRVAVST